jgi:hypothetical protein
MSLVMVMQLWRGYEFKKIHSLSCQIVLKVHQILFVNHHSQHVGCQRMTSGLKNQCLGTAL